MARKIIMTEEQFNGIVGKLALKEGLNPYEGKGAKIAEIRRELEIEDIVDYVERQFTKEDIMAELDSEDCDLGNPDDFCYYYMVDHLNVKPEWAEEACRRLGEHYGW